MTVGVFIAHVNYDWLPGSILYMDTFFMMSSFFITRLLLKDWARRGCIDYRSFYIRRVKRLYPALLLMVATITGIAVVGLRQTMDNTLHIWGTLFYFANWLRAFDIPHNPILGHTWSLSIEEQFYLVWPILLGLGLAGTRRSAQPSISNPNAVNRMLWATTLCLLVLATFGWRAYLALSGSIWPRTYNGTDMRLDSLALGALLALTYDSTTIQRSCIVLAKPLLVWLLLACIFIGSLIVDVREPKWYAWQQPLFVLVSLLLLMAFLKTPVRYGLRALFQNPVSLYLGAICYGLYLWHYPVVKLAKEHWNLPETQTLLICAPLCILIAGVSYRWVELPALKGHRGSAK